MYLGTGVLGLSGFLRRPVDGFVRGHSAHLQHGDSVGVAALAQAGHNGALGGVSCDGSEHCAVLVRDV